MAIPFRSALLLVFLATVSCAAPTAPVTPISAIPPPPPDLVEQVDSTSILWIREPSGTGSAPAEDMENIELYKLAEEFAGAGKFQLVAVYPNLKALAVRGDRAAVEDLARKDPWLPLLQSGSDFLVSIYDGAECLAPTSPPSRAIVPIGVERVGGPFSSGFQGKRVWIIDSGIAGDTADGQLNVDRSMAANCVYLPSNPLFEPVCKSGQSADVTDTLGHGTMVAGIIAASPRGGAGLYGVAPAATVVPVKAFDANGYADLAQGPMRAIDYVTAHASAGDVVNISWGGDWTHDLETFLATYHRVNAAIRRLAGKGVKIAIAAGNSTNWVQFVAPAGAGGYRAANGGVVMTASAVDSSRFAWFFWKDKFWPSSNYGVGTPDFAEPGVNIMSLWPGNRVRTCSGTSFAAPHLAGILLRGLPRDDGYAEGDLDKQGNHANEDRVGRCCAP